MTMSRAYKLGYDVKDVCPLCGEVGDTVFHRAYKCRVTSPIVRAAVPKWFWEEAQRQGGGDRFWTTGCIPHPADCCMPKVRDEYAARVTDEDGCLLDDPGLQGNIFIDGSCTTSVWREMQRAAFSAVQVSEEGRAEKTVSMPLWSSLPQTPQAAEHAVMAAVVQLLRGPSTIFGDCKGVIDAMAKGPKGYLDGSLRYGGVLLFTQKYPEGLSHVREIVKVKAHQCINAALSPTERWRAVGNDLADKAAKAAVGRHDQPSAAQSAQLKFWARRIPYVVKAVATAMAEFPPAGGNLPRKPPRQRSGATARGEEDDGSHRWQFVEGRWRCTRCWTYVQGSPATPPPRKGQRCNAERVTAELKKYTARGHAMLFADAALPFAFCSRCGGWSARRNWRHNASAGERSEPAAEYSLSLAASHASASGRRDRAQRRYAAGSNPIGL